MGLLSKLTKIHKKQAVLFIRFGYTEDYNKSIR